MTDDERRLADLLHGTTPQPPHGVDADELMRGEQRARRLRYWPQLAAAAAVVIVAGGIAAVAGTANDSSNQGVGGPSPAPTASAHCDHVTLLVGRRTKSAVGTQSQPLTFYNIGSTPCVVRDLKLGLDSQRRSGRLDAYLVRKGTTRIMPGEVMSTSLTWIEKAGWPTRRFVTFQFLHPQTIRFPFSPVVASVYPTGSPRAGQLAVTLAPLRLTGRVPIQFPSTPTSGGTAGSTTDVPVKTVTPPPTGSSSSQGTSGKIKDCVLGMQPSLGKVTANGTRRSVTLYFRNISGKPCATYAAPGLLATPTHSRNGIMVDLVNSGFRQGVLQPGKRAYSTLTWTDDPKRPTARYTTLQVLNPIVHYAKEIDLPISYEISDRRMVCTGLRPVGS